TGTIAGTITDGKNKAIEGALVTLDDAFVQQTGPDGAYRFVCVEPGTRTISVHRSGYTSIKQTLKVAQNREASGSFQMAEKK
ncbi:carboxypeptidase regulatory-like domain-containing protein, partial [bacterium]|nr:carboxypeptidase regulatory-like domain-containing protein [bacterium]